MSPAKHIPNHLRESAEFANARIDALQAALAVKFSDGKGGPPEDFFMKAFQDLDRELVEKWDNIGPAIREREDS